MPGELKSYDYPPRLRAGRRTAASGRRWSGSSRASPNVTIDSGVLTAAARAAASSTCSSGCTTRRAWDGNRTRARQAAKNGHVHVLEWLRYGARLPLTITPPADDPWAHAETFTDAAKAGHLDVLKWAHLNTSEFNRPESWSLAASVGGHVHVLRWMATLQGANSHHFDPAIYQAVNRNQIDVLKWAHEEAGFVRAGAAHVLRQRAPGGIARGRRVVSGDVSGPGAAGSGERVSRVCA